MKVSLVNQKTKKTNRKFYNKWLYKVSLSISGASVFRQTHLNNIESYCSESSDDRRSWSLSSKIYNNKEQLIFLANFLKKFPEDTWAKRIETNNIDFYSNDKKFYDSLSLEFEDQLIHRFEPSEEAIDLLSEELCILSKKLPHNRYTYRVYLLPHKMAGDREGKEKYISWLKNQHEKITCTPAIETWFVKTDWNWDRRYVLVEDEQTLLMMKLRNSEVVGKIYRYVICDK